MKKIAFILLLLASPYYWHSNKIENKILTYSKKNCDSFPQQDCTIFLEDALGIKWDTVFLFHEYIFGEDVSEEWNIKFDFGMVKDSHARIVFIYNGMITYSKEYKLRGSKIQFPYTELVIANNGLGVRIKQIRNNFFNIVFVTDTF